MCEFIPFSLWRLTFGAISSHGWLTLTDARDVVFVALTRHMWEVVRAPICTHRRFCSHATTDASLGLTRVCNSAQTGKCTRAIIVHQDYMRVRLLMFWPWVCVVSSVTCTYQQQYTFAWRYSKCIMYIWMRPIRFDNYIFANICTLLVCLFQLRKQCMSLFGSSSRNKGNIMLIPSHNESFTPKQSHVLCIIDTNPFQSWVFSVTMYAHYPFRWGFRTSWQTTTR